MSTHPTTNYHVPGIWTHLGETLHIWRHHLGETLNIWRQRYRDRQEPRPMDRPGPARRWPLVERHRLRSRKTLLAGLIRQPSAGAASIVNIAGASGVHSKRLQSAKKPDRAIQPVRR